MPTRQCRIRAATTSGQRPFFVRALVVRKICPHCTELFLHYLVVGHFSVPCREPVEPE